MDWVRCGEALRKALPEHLDVLTEDLFPGAQRSWTNGGCFVAARAIACLVRGELWAIAGTPPLWSLPPGHPGGPQLVHTVCQTPDGEGFLDADGFSSLEQLLSRWRELGYTDVSCSVLDWRLGPARASVNSNNALHGVFPRKELRLAGELEARLRPLVEASC